MPSYPGDARQAVEDLLGGGDDGDDDGEGGDVVSLGGPGEP